MRGSILDTSERSSMQYWLYIRLRELITFHPCDCRHSFIFISVSFIALRHWCADLWHRVVQGVLSTLPNTGAEEDCVQRHSVQSSRRAVGRDDHVLLVRSRWKIVGEDEEISALDARVRVAIQLPTKRIHKPKLATTKSDARIPRQLEQSMQVPFLLHGLIGSQQKLLH
jgi:hypothetical protein